MATNHIKELKDTQKLAGEVRKNCPDVMKAFGNLHGKVMGDGALPLKTKELIAIGISIAIRCKPCIQTHVKSALNAGATPEEINETVEVAILTGGGPATAYGAYVIEAMNQFLAE